MCKRNNLKHSNEAQFYVTLGAPLTFMDNKYVIFGRVISGMRAFKLVEKLETTNERPNEVVKIVKAGIYTYFAKKWKLWDLEEPEWRGRYIWKFKLNPLRFWIWKKSEYEQIKKRQEAIKCNKTEF